MAARPGRCFFQAGEIGGLYPATNPKNSIPRHQRPAEPVARPYPHDVVANVPRERRSARTAGEATVDGIEGQHVGHVAELGVHVFSSHDPDRLEADQCTPQDRGDTNSHMQAALVKLK